MALGPWGRLLLLLLVGIVSSTASWKERRTTVGSRLVGTPVTQPWMDSGGAGNKKNEIVFAASDVVLE